MPILILLVLLFLAPPDEVQECIAAFQALPTSAERERILLLEDLHRLNNPEADRFLARAMEPPGTSRVRSRAFLLWATRRTQEEVVALLQARKRQPGFDLFIQNLPALSNVDAFEVLTGLLDDQGLGPFKRSINMALASLDSMEAYLFLKERWEKATSFKEAFEVLPALLSMKPAQRPGFSQQLLNSNYPFARFEGAIRLLRDRRVNGIIQVSSFMERETHPGVRHNLLHAMARRPTPEAVKALLAALASQPASSHHEIVEALTAMPPPMVRAAIPPDWYLNSHPVRFQAAALALSSSSELFEALEVEELRLLKEGMLNKDIGVRLVSALALARLTRYNGQALQKIKNLVYSAQGDTGWNALQTIQQFRLEDDVIQDRLMSLLGFKNLEIRIKAAEVLGSLGITKAIPLLKKFFSGRDLLLRIAAIRALGSMGGKESVLFLLERLPREKGRVAWEIARALTEITGRNFGINMKQWDRWWTLSEEELSRPPYQDGLWYQEGKKDERYGFYGLPIDSHNIVFVLDISGSMSGERIATLRQELAKTLESMSEEHLVNMIFFNTNVKKWQNKLVPMGGKGVGYKARALLKVKYLQASGGTNLYGGLEAALKDKQVDTVVLLSDGNPTVGKIVDKTAIVEAIRKMNRVLQVRIHTIAIGGADRGFMRSLALSSGGIFTSI